MKMKTNKKVYVFGHNDLDGVGVQILGRMYAQVCGAEVEVHQCTYTTINNEVMQMLKDVPVSKIHTVIIGDISVNKEVAQHLNAYYKSEHLPVILRDHHATAEHLNQYNWAMVSEKDQQGTLRCGTYWLWDYLMVLMPESFSKMETFVKVVDSWDTWKWKTDNIGIYANYLNALHKIHGSKKFTDYIMNLDMRQVSKPKDLFDTYAEVLVKTHEEIALHTARSCEESLWVTQIGFKPQHKSKDSKYLVFNMGIVFCNNDISEVADYIFTKHPELDFIMIGNLPKAFSFRTQKKLAIPLGDIADMITGSGGGHPFSAGATIDAKQFQTAFYKFMNSLGTSSEFNMVSLYPECGPSLVSDTKLAPKKLPSEVSEKPQKKPVKRVKTKKEPKVKKVAVKTTKKTTTKRKFGKPNKTKIQDRG